MSPARVVLAGWLAGVGLSAVLAFLWLVYPPAVIGAAGVCCLSLAWRVSRVASPDDGGL